MLPERAAAAFEGGDWRTAAALYHRLVGLEPARSVYWLRLGTALHRTGQEDQALGALEQAERAGAAVSQVAWELALVQGARSDARSALAQLGRAIRDGRGRPDLIESAPELQALHGKSEFDQLVGQARRNEAPC